MVRTRIRFVTRVGRSGPSRRAFLAGSLVAHVLLFSAALWLPSLHGATEFPEEFVEVQLAAPAAEARPQPVVPAAAPPAPDPLPEAPPEEAHIETREPVQVDEPAETPEKRPQPEPQQPRPTTAESRTPSRSAGDANPSPAPQAATPEVNPGGAGSITAMEGDDEFAWYRASVTAALYSHWQRPILSGVGEPAESGVSFEILRDGTVRGLRIQKRSGIPSLDRSALRAVSDAAPLPPLPANWREPVLPARFAFILHPED